MIFQVNGQRQTKKISMTKTFLPVFLFTHFCVLKNIAKKSIHHTLLENLFFVIETVLHLSITTFFECEMNISTIECISESENMEWMIKQLSKS